MLASSKVMADCKNTCHNTYHQKIQSGAAVARDVSPMRSQFYAGVPEWSKGLALRSNIGNDARVQTSPPACPFSATSA